MKPSFKTGLLGLNLTAITLIAIGMYRKFTEVLPFCTRAGLPSAETGAAVGISVLWALVIVPGMLLLTGQQRYRSKLKLLVVVASLIFYLCALYAVASSWSFEPSTTRCK